MNSLQLEQESWGGREVGARGSKEELPDAGGARGQHEKGLWAFYKKGCPQLTASKDMGNSICNPKELNFSNNLNEPGSPTFPNSLQRNAPAADNLISAWWGQQRTQLSPVVPRFLTMR